MPRRYKRRKRRKRSSTVVSLARQPFPKSFVTKHRYVQTFTLDPGISVPATQLFRCLNIFDPDYTGTGHQPLGYDQMTPIYDHYNVLGAKIKVKAMSAAADAGSGGTVVGIYIDDDQIPSSQYDTILEQGNGVSRILTGNTANGYVTMSKTFSTKKWFGVKDVMDNDKLQGSNIAGSTDDDAYMVVYAQGLASLSNPSAVYCIAEIEYIVKWTEPKTLNQS